MFPREFQKFSEFMQNLGDKQSVLWEIRKWRIQDLSALWVQHSRPVKSIFLEKEITSPFPGYTCNTAQTMLLWKQQSLASWYSVRLFHDPFFMISQAQPGKA